AQRLIEEAQCGLAWLHKTRFGDGFRVTWGTMDYWTDNKIGTADDTFVSPGNAPTDNAVGAAASAIAARLLESSNPELSAKSLQIARDDWRFAIERLKNPNVEALGAVTLASVELYKATGEPKYADKAVELGKLLVESQQRSYPNWAISLAGFFYNSPQQDRILNFMHRGHDQAPVVALAELCKALPDHADWMQWYSAVAMHSEYQRTAAAFNEPYNLLNAGIYRLRDNPAQVSKGLKLSDEYYLRRFPVWGDLRGHFGVLLSQTKALATAGRLRNRPELLDLCQSQLQWVVGKNPFAQSTMYGEGYDYAPQYTAASGDMVGSLPVGIQTKYDFDVPYWPVTNCWNYKEVWVHPSSRWLFTMADLVAASKEQSVHFELSQKAASDGRVIVTAKVTGNGRHTFAIRAFNLEADPAAQAVELQAGVSQTLTWSAKVRATDTPWVVVIYPDNDLSQRQDLTAPARRVP
ncbi:MAG TPA: glycoside hydrolase family 9 protein, partial [Tepidisphaeraceae bacterium]|nr:glycoside hydrolase family 9 protein [Tepidisphaeraceae bacterium]